MNVVNDDRSLAVAHTLLVDEYDEDVQTVATIICDQIIKHAADTINLDVLTHPKHWVEAAAQEIVAHLNLRLHERRV